MKNIENKINHKLIKKALTIRTVEEKFLSLFSEGKLNGTVHTCVGQEFSALAFAGQLQKKDFVFSNHRCHGHYIAFTGDVRGLLAELLGKASGTCGGIGSSQHLCNSNFFSNGIQGGIVPVAAGYALANKLKKNNAIGCVFIGDGTLGEGVLYETMNIISKWEIPLLIVCENNFYAQSTHQSINLAGDILQRAAAFGIKTAAGTTDEPEELITDAEEAISFVRNEKKPLFFLVDTYRLNPHSKGDDNREEAEIAHYRQKDYLEIFRRDEPVYNEKYQNEISGQVDHWVEGILEENETNIEEYFKTEEPVHGGDIWEELNPINRRQVDLINQFFREQISINEQLIFIGEDILSPYGGAFKVAKDLSQIAPDRVFSTPISEAALVGISNGLALNGFKPFAEIMFNKKANCPVVIRTPMGGRRGYGPTHSQTLDKFLIGIDNIKTIALHTFFDPSILYKAVMREQHPVIIIENKTDYGKKIIQQKASNFIYEMNGDNFPVVRIRPELSDPTLTIVAYGGMAAFINSFLNELFLETEQKPELIVPSLISQLPLHIIADSVEKTGQLLVVEEGSTYGGLGSELISSLAELSDKKFKSKRIGAFPVPIPSAKSLEDAVLPDRTRIIKEIKASFQ